MLFRLLAVSGGKKCLSFTMSFVFPDLHIPTHENILTTSLSIDTCIFSNLASGQLGANLRVLETNHAFPHENIY